MSVEAAPTAADAIVGIEDVKSAILTEESAAGPGAEAARALGSGSRRTLSGASGRGAISAISSSISRFER
jgi:hypothetical protein